MCPSLKRVKGLICYLQNGAYAQQISVFLQPVEHLQNRTYPGIVITTMQLNYSKNKF